MPEEIIQVEDHFYILATSSRADDRFQVIKDDESFGVFDRGGAIRRVGLGEQGVYHESTRYLSRFELAIQGRPLQPLHSRIGADNVLAVELTNPDYLDLAEPVPRDSLHILLTSLLFHGAWYAQVAIRNYSLRPIEVEVSFGFAADYADIFEVRGTKRPRRGTLLEPRPNGSAVVLGYDGLDGVRRQTQLAFSPQPQALDGTSATFTVQLAPHEVKTLELTASFASNEPGNSPISVGAPTTFARARNASTAALERQTSRALLGSSNSRVDEWIERSACDIRMMTTATSSGPYPYAGVPWFSTVFGRDGIITAFETLWLDPELARGVLAHLAATQATEISPERDAEPGKIVHETRRGEMAALGEIPFGSYYGSVDATPLFVALAGAYWRRTADLELIERLWPNIERALNWIDEHGDRDGDGFVEYARRTSMGLVSQGWKDSTDSISHHDGAIAEGPIALCEVQGYVYAARRAGATLARVLGHDDEARRLDALADELRLRFESSFWSDDLGTYCLALDGAKRPCLVRASNASHALFSGIASPEHATKTCAALLSPHSFSGWGIRTLDAREARYNPMSYHNGSIWPHDNAIAALGMARYGHKDEALKVLTAIYRASVHFDLHRLPELFCGFPRTEHDVPTPYPVACAPQAWAAGAVFMLLEACIGIQIDATHRQVRFVRPLLPDNIERLTIRNLHVGAATADLTLHRQGPHVGVFVDACEGDLEILAVKRDR